MNELTARQVTITDAYWSPRLAVNATLAIFHQWRELEKSGCLDNFRLLTGDRAGFREGWFFADSDAYKWLDAAARIYASSLAAQLKALMDTVIDLFARAHPRVKGHAGKVALARGPLVYCLESVDNPDVDRSLTFIPYQLWANRGASQMTVWVNV